MQRILRQKVVQATYAYLIQRDLAAEELRKTPSFWQAPLPPEVKKALEHSVCPLPPPEDNDLTADLGSLLNNYSRSATQVQKQVHKHSQESLEQLLQGYYLVWVLFIRLHEQLQGMSQAHVLKSNELLAVLSPSLTQMVTDEGLKTLSPAICLEILQTWTPPTTSADAQGIIRCLRKGLLKNPTWAQWIESQDQQWEEHYGYVLGWVTQSLKESTKAPITEGMTVMGFETSIKLVSRFQASAGLHRQVTGVCV